MLEGGKVGGELVCRATAECCLTGAGVGEGGLVMEWMSLAGLGAVGGGTGLGETGGGIFFPSTTEMEREREKRVQESWDTIGQYALNKVIFRYCLYNQVVFFPQNQQSNIHAYFAQVYRSGPVVDLLSNGFKNGLTPR